VPASLHIRITEVLIL